ncbi:pyruvate kinase, partial [Xanthomonas citri pv. citri]|nr:pyruvate kinase [Xanthomonas citri pv. citri]
VAIFADLQGPKIRLGRFTDGPHLLERGDRITITTRDVPGTRELVGTTHKGLPGDVAPGDVLLVEKDERDLRWALRTGVDMVALSFVRDAADVDRVHEIMDEEERRVPVIAKIEKPQAVENLEAIVDAFDAIMVARGDLGVELPLEDVPVVQKRAVDLARRWAKP